MMFFRVILFFIFIVMILIILNVEEMYLVIRDINFFCLISCVMVRICYLFVFWMVVEKKFWENDENLVEDREIV